MHTPSVEAQQVSANGTTVTASGTIITVDMPALIATTNAGVPGIINSFAPLTISTSGNVAPAPGAIATGGSQITIFAGSTIATTGTDGYGAYSVGNLLGNPSLISLGSGTVISTSGANAYGLVAESLGAISATGITLTTSGSGANGIALFGGASILDMAVTIEDSTISVLGANAAGVYSTSGNNAVSLTGSTLAVADGAAFEVAAGVLFTELTNSTVTGGDELLNVSSTGALDMEAVGSTLTGSATTAVGGTSTLILRNTRWNVTDDSNVSFVFNHAGSLVQFTPPGSSAGPFKTLTVNDYAGQGGTLGVNTYLGNDSSPSDRLAIDGGNGVGTSLLAVNNVGGGGDLTTLDGILIVEAINSATVPGLFSLAAPVIAGPYQYSLYRGGENGANPDNWYLRSDLDCSLDPSAPVCGDDIPDWRQETSLYAAVPAMTLLYGRLMLDTLHERRGTAVSAYAEGAPNAAWARVIGQHGDRDGGKGGIYGAGPKYDYDFWAFQGGMDLYRDG
ncbi:autotransporter outer membrane beta-barrel domain-containing protein, partial [Hyphomicrobium sulfonivorans]|uniref:autotransporter outer membrane beta-barrel domain-containing protein n=1 Tax=Hyphomicrobium sulfonivorans TaxID=121290 RepID=UPI000AFC3FC1